jgi:DNA invertase Pin-like site-specific DNA recombinase
VKVAIHARVSTVDPEPENQRQELRQYGGARGWSAVAQTPVSKGESYGNHENAQSTTV